MRSFWMALLGIVVCASSASACAVCYGDPDSPLTKSIGWGVWVLVGFIGGVLSLFAALFLNIRRRMKNLSAAKSLTV